MERDRERARLGHSLVWFVATYNVPRLSFWSETLIIRWLRLQQIGIGSLRYSITCIWKAGSVWITTATGASACHSFALFQNKSVYRRVCCLGCAVKICWLRNTEEMLGDTELMNNISFICHFLILQCSSAFKPWELISLVRGRMTNYLWHAFV